jgi:excisionase family DNA binding protein
MPKNRAPGVVSEAAPRAVLRLGPLQEAADYWAVHERTVRRMIADGKLSAYRVGGHLLRINMAEVEALTVPVAPESVSA